MVLTLEMSVLILRSLTATQYSRIFRPSEILRNIRNIYASLITIYQITQDALEGCRQQLPWRRSGVGSCWVCWRECQWVWEASRAWSRPRCQHSHPAVQQKTHITRLRCGSTLSTGTRHIDVYVQLPKILRRIRRFYDCHRQCTIIRPVHGREWFFFWLKSMLWAP